MKIKKYLLITVLVILIILFGINYLTPDIDRRTWMLSFAHQTEPFLVVAHGPEYDFSNDDTNLLDLSKEIELVCSAKKGKITLTDKTNGKVYNGTYKVTSWNRLYGQHYSVIIDGTEGTAYISTNTDRTLSILIGGYNLTFETHKIY